MALRRLEPWVVRLQRGWWRYALPISVLLNFFLIAVIGGHVLRHRDPGEGVAVPLFQRLLTNIRANLSAQDAAAFGSVMLRSEPRYAQSARGVSDARGLGTARIFTADGRHVASIAQEALAREREARAT